MRRNPWAVLGVALLLVGIVLFATAGSAPDDFGWFAYAPLDDRGPLSGDVLFLSRGRLVGALVGGIGLLVIAAGFGYRAGVRRDSAPPDPSA